MLHYFIKNIILLLLSFYAILRITHLLVGLNYLDDNLHLCINLISISLFFYYIIRYLEFSYTLITQEQRTHRVFENICSVRSFINIYVLCTNCGPSYQIVQRYTVVLLKITASLTTIR